MTNQSAPPLFPREAVNDLLEARDSYRRAIATVLTAMAVNQDTPNIIEGDTQTLIRVWNEVMRLPQGEWDAIKGMLDAGT